ncbi:formylglycine-generating enzyme family protein [Tengunoibacter tsumagoiensis]|uniref:Sulfatase-modifying factor enzyme-like domain-containing protein n=1 Tax=Tengunoibacter tsumagoiensis TaxID=2014871 RepID=A0A402AAA3_9CHLR|nr:SUMF1/EgtB/PvdO family nonheme iron enzyme [Tengunoibacter tsumagoiensis]GCE15966.1 hypothetical protein KTT_58250 [Tengunoibacter tsumagoiensis]
MFLPPRMTQLGFKAFSTNGVEYVIPPTCHIPGGKFVMGNRIEIDPQMMDDEHPRHPLLLPDYYIAAYPVTVVEYELFVHNGGKAPETRGLVSWAQQIRNPEHPVVCVQWVDAVAYTKWLSALSGRKWRLPTEPEWEKAARWDVKNARSLIYPWGNQFDKNRCNTRESQIGTTIPIGYYGAKNKSPYNVFDMAGNIWEWTSSIYKPYPYVATDGREDPTPQEHSHRVSRGGAWRLPLEVSRSACRNFESPTNFAGYFDDEGFRLALDL